MAPQLPITEQPQHYLPPVPINERALDRFDRRMSRRLAKFEQRFFVPRVNPKLDSLEGRRSAGR